MSETVHHEAKARSTEACRLVRKMRGGSQAHLIEAADGYSYIVKFSHNPQGRRILVNEWIVSTILRELGISTPQVAIVNVSEEFLTGNPDVFLQLKTDRQPVAAGCHFGSRFPEDPKITAVYDFLPETLLTTVANIDDFFGVLAVDKWVGNEDARQCIFFRGLVREFLPTVAAHALQIGFVAQMIDNGGAFQGPQWDLATSAIQGLYCRPIVYRGVRGLADFEPWLTRITTFPEEILIHAAKQVPNSWLGNENGALEVLFARLMRRRALVPELITCCRRARLNLFPSWH
jgi:hypothetical protein